MFLLTMGKITVFLSIKRAVLDEMVITATFVTSMFLAVLELLILYIYSHFGTFWKQRGKKATQAKTQAKDELFNPS